MIAVQTITRRAEDAVHHARRPVRDGARGPSGKGVLGLGFASAKAHAGTCCRRLGTPPCQAQSRRPTHNNRAADPVQESAAPSNATRGCLPSRASERWSFYRDRVLLVNRADRVAQYKMTRQRGTARSMRGARSERDARLDTLRALTCRTSCTTGRTDIASLPSGCPWSATVKQRVEESHRGECPTEHSAGPEACERAGLRSSRGSTCAAERTPTVRPDSRDFGPLPGPARGC